MEALVSLAAANVILLAVLCSIQLVILAFRNPFRPSWFKRHGLDNVVAVAIAAGMSFAIAFEITSLIASGLPAIIAIAAAPLIALVMAYASWRLLDGSERLKRADAGQSPFQRREKVAGLPDASLGT